MQVDIIIKSDIDYSNEYKKNVYNLLNDYHKEFISVKKSRIISYCIIYEYLKTHNIELNINDIYYSKNGKPLLNGLYFSISNKDNLVVLVISYYNIGVDIEKIINYDESIVKKFFTHEEESLVKTNYDFFRIYTLKESYIKMKDLKYDSYYKDDYTKYYNETVKYKDYIISYVIDVLK